MKFDLAFKLVFFFVFLPLRSSRKSSVLISINIINYLISDMPKISWSTCTIGTPKILLPKSCFKPILWWIQLWIIISSIEVITDSLKRLSLTISKKSHWNIYRNFRSFLKFILKYFTPQNILVSKKVLYVVYNSTHRKCWQLAKRKMHPIF